MAWPKSVIAYEVGWPSPSHTIPIPHARRAGGTLTIGRTGAFVLETQSLGWEATQARLERVGLALERQKPYLLERWR